MNTPKVLFELVNDNKIILSVVTIKELDNLKDNKDFVKSYKTRQALHCINDLLDNPNLFIDIHETIVPILDNTSCGTFKNDDIILSCAFYNDAMIFTNDIGMRIKGKSILSLSIFEHTEQQHEYMGYTNVTATEEELADIYTNPYDNIYNIPNNQYVVIHNTNNEVIDILKWNGLKYCNLNYKTFKEEFIGKAEPRSLEQKLAFDMLQDDNITIKVLLGRQGVGKDFLMLSHALHFINNKKYKKILWVRNNIEVKDTNPIGALPDGIKDKLLPFAEIMSDHLDGTNNLLYLISSNKIEIEHLGFMRGRDIKNSIILCSDAENMTKEHMQLLVGRISDNSALWINGDVSQVDSSIFERNNGLTAITDSLLGNTKFGYIKLNNVERSETAMLADLIK